MRILIADDDIVSLKKCNILIKGMGYETLTAANGKEAFKIWKKDRPRLVITDWIMPEMDGIELCRNIRKEEGSQYTYIIIVSFKNETTDKLEGLDAGADEFITKPYNKEEIALRIRSGMRIIHLSSRDIVVFSISKLAESRDPETGNHLERIRFYSKVLAQTLSETYPDFSQIDPFFIENLFLTSPLHDIGKIGIPDYILLKPARLDSNEFDIMKKHTLIGYNTLNEAAKMDLKADYLRMSADIALCHHEKFDGTGYPNGLKGDEIPLAARIVALADVYDALVNKRVYKAAMSHDIALSIIRDEKNKHFDHRIVDAFLECRSQFCEIHEKFRPDDF